MANAKTKEELIEAVCDYKKGWTNLENATKEISNLSGLDTSIASAFLKAMKRNNVTQIRGYSKEPERLLKGKQGKTNQLKRK